MLGSLESMACVLKLPHPHPNTVLDMSGPLHDAKECPERGCTGGSCMSWVAVVLSITQTQPAPYGGASYWDQVAQSLYQGGVTAFTREMTCCEALLLQGALMCPARCLAGPSCWLFGIAAAALRYLSVLISSVEIHLKLERSWRSHSNSVWLKLWCRYNRS